jgi:hypothetical protein
MALSMKTTVFWNVVLCSLVGVDQISDVLAASIISAVMMEGTSTSGMSPNFYQTTQCNIPEDSLLQQENMCVKCI